MVFPHVLSRPYIFLGLTSRDSLNGIFQNLVSFATEHLNSGTVHRIE